MPRYSRPRPSFSPRRRGKRHASRAKDPLDQTACHRVPVRHPFATPFSTRILRRVLFCTRAASFATCSLRTRRLLVLGGDKRLRSDVQNRLLGFDHSFRSALERIDDHRRRSRCRAELLLGALKDGLVLLAGKLKDLVL